ncbi:hypothetical protein P3T40_009179, partial [Paraburkholderia sp. EB58]
RIASLFNINRVTGLTFTSSVGSEPLPRERFSPVGQLRTVD